MSLVYPDIPGNPNKKNPGVCRLSVNSLISGNKKLEENITLTEIAQRTAGFSGADLENLMNEPLCRTHEFFLHLTRSVVRFFFCGGNSLENQGISGTRFKRVSFTRLGCTGLGYNLLYSTCSRDWEFVARYPQINYI